MNYRDFNDNELMSYVHESEDARDTILKKYEPLISKTAGRMLNSCPYIGIDKSDLIQEGLLGLTHAIDYYNEAKDVSFYTFAKTCIERSMISALLTYKRLKHKALNESVSYDVDEDDLVFDKILKDNSMNPEEIMVDEDKTEKLILSIEGQLTDFELQVFHLMVSSFTYREIADILDKDKKQIDNAIQRIKGKVKKQLEVR